MNSRHIHFNLGLIGYPLEHSLSPALHRTALEANQLAGDYHLFAVLPLPRGQQTLQELIDKLRKGDIQGLNVTIPHKQNVIPLVDELSDSARRIGAVNVLLCRDGKIIGDNSDAAGFLSDLHGFLSRSTEQQTTGKHALVLGAGGSARAVVFALLQDGWRVTVAARREEQARQLAADLTADSDSQPLQVITLEEHALATQREISLVVNTTPLGMYPHISQSPWPPNLSLPFSAVYDLIYNPPETTLVQMARAAGLPAISGAGMLVEQAALSFELWTGYPAPRQEMKQAMTRYLNCL